MALVVVLWIFVFLFVVAFDFSASVREEGMAVHRYAEETEGYYLALAGFQEALYRLLQGSVSEGQPSRVRAARADSLEVVDGTWSEGNLGEGLYRVRLVDEGGKVNLNRVDEATLTRILANLGVEEPRRSVLLDSIFDWRDEDDLHRTNGAESDYYLSLSVPYTAKNGLFDAVEELLWVRGMPPELFYGTEGGAGLKDIFSVDSPMDRINLRTAPAEVIHALTGLPLEKSRAFVEERKKLSEKTIADMLKLLGIAAGDAALRQFIFTNPSVIAIEAVGGHSGSAAERQVKAVIRLMGGQRGYQVIRWIDRDMIQGKMENAN
ncbi:MAG: general secretion pathway protein GspK [Deltaproteobacteria bacterium]|nr:general secretion pathway protein GspK [Deltaproteobacteria bacterium]